MKRHAFPLLQELLGLFPCVALLGVRQCGKTTLLRELLPDWRLFDMEKLADHEAIARDPDLFLRDCQGQLKVKAVVDLVRPGACRNHQFGTAEGSASAGRTSP